MFSPMHLEWSADASLVSICMIATALIFLFLLPVRYMFAWGSLQRAEKQFAPRILDLFQSDWNLTLSNSWIILFSFATLLSAFVLLPSTAMAVKQLLAIWIICFGISIDASIYFAKRVLQYINPFSVIKLFGQKAQQSIQNEKELDLCRWIDGLTEIAIKGIDQNSTSITHLAVGEMQRNARLFFETSKGIGYHDQDSQTRSLGISDKATFIAFYLYQRLDMIFEKALKNRFEPTCSYVISVLGKMALDAAKYDISMASAPLRFIGKLSKKAQDEGLEETALKSSITLLEVAKALMKEIDLTYLEIKDPYLSIINGMEQLAKGVFKADKTSSVAFLMQPFQELKQLFETEKMQAHADTPVIIQNINRILGEFEALQMVMNTMPPMPSILSEQSLPPSSEKL